MDTTCRKEHNGVQKKKHNGHYVTKSIHDLGSIPGSVYRQFGFMPEMKVHTCYNSQKVTVHSKCLNTHIKHNRQKRLVIYNQFNAYLNLQKNIC